MCILRNQYDIFNQITLASMIAGEKLIHHMSGTECDFHIRSDGVSSTRIRSPSNYQPGVECTILLDGMQSRQKLEHVTVDFTLFNIESRIK